MWYYLFYSLCCAYLAFKVEEYNVSVDQFVHVLARELRQSVSEFVLSHELLLLRRLKFHLTVHSPFRPMEGFIIDMKVGSSSSIHKWHGYSCISFQTRTPNIPNPDQFRKVADSFLVKSLSSDVAMFYPPSQVDTDHHSLSCVTCLFCMQVALAALFHSSKQTRSQIDGYVASNTHISTLDGCVEELE